MTMKFRNKTKMERSEPDLYWGHEENEDWKSNAACNGEDQALFFPERGQSLEPAKEICKKCPVELECLIYSYRTGVDGGIWGGLSNKHRLKIRKFYENMDILDG